MPSEFRKHKYRYVFERFWDHNNDGCIDKKDIDMIIEKACYLRGWKPGEPQYKKIQETWYKILDGMMDQLDVNKDGEITLEEWMVLYDDYTKNPSQPREWVQMYEDFVYELINTRETDAAITKEEYLRVFTHFGVPLENAEIAFQRTTKGKDSITKAEFAQLWKEYFSSDDPDAPGNALCGY